MKEKLWKKAGIMMLFMLGACILGGGISVQTEKSVAAAEGAGAVGTVGAVEENVVSYVLSEGDLSLAEYGGFSFDFMPSAVTSYDVEITAADGTVWSTEISPNTAYTANGLNGYRGSGVLLNRADAVASAYYTNVFENIAAGSYSVYIPFSFFTGKTDKDNATINPVFKVRGYTDEYGLTDSSGSHSLPTEIRGTVKFVCADQASATALKQAVSGIKAEHACPFGAELKLAERALNSAYGYGISNSRRTVNFLKKDALVKWNAGTGIGASAGFLLKFGNTGKNDLRIRFAIAENTDGKEVLTESYSGAKSEAEYYTFIHCDDSVKPKGTEDKLYVFQRKAYVPAGYQGIMLLPFSRLRFQADGYLNYDKPINGRLNTILGTIRMFVDNISDEAALENGLTFYVLNSVIANTGLGVSFKSVGASGGSSIVADSATTATVSETTGRAVSALGTELSSVSADKTNLYVGQTVRFTVNYGEENAIPFLYTVSGSDTIDISDRLVKESESETTAEYSYRKTSQSEGDLTFSLKNAYKVSVKEGNTTLYSDICVEHEDYVFNASKIQKDHYAIESVKIGDTVLTANADGDYKVENISDDTEIFVTYRVIEHNVVINVRGQGSYSFTEGDETLSWFEKATIVFVPEKGWKLAGVTVNGEERRGTEITVDKAEEDILVDAVFEEIEYHIHIAVSGNGSAVPDVETVHIGGGFTITVAASTGSVFSGITVNELPAELVDGAYSGICTGEDIEVSVIFESVKYSVTVRNGEGGVCSADEKVEHGASVLVSLAADEGYVLKALSVNGETVSTDGQSYLITDCTGDVTIEAIWEKIPSQGGCKSNMSLLPTLSALSVICVITAVLIKRQKKR